MEIRDYSKGDENQILVLFEQVFKKPMSLNYWLWRFQNNPAGKHFIKLMWDEGKLVGHYAVSPVVMQVDGKPCLTTLSMSTMTHPEYGGRGIFKDLAFSIYNQLEQEKDVVNIWGYPNGNSHYGFIKNLGWKDLAVVHTLAITTERFTPSLSDKIEIASDFSNEHAQQLSECAAAFSVKIDRSVAYLKWRYIDNPSNKYTIFQFKDSSEFVVAKLYRSPNVPGTWEVFIMEFGMKDVTKSQEMFEYIMAYYNEPISRFCIWMSLWHPMHIQLEKIGFVPFGKQTFIGARYNENTHQSIGDFRNWYYSFGDSDVY